MSVRKGIQLNRCLRSVFNYLDDKFSDLTIINNGKKYSVHKIILCSAIPYFDKMFSSGMRESTVNELQLDHPTETFDIIIDWIYNRNICITNENVFQLFQLADLMCITDLIDECLTYLFNNYSDDLLADIEYIMKLTPNSQVISTIARYVKHNCKAIIASANFLSFDFETVHFMINCSGLNIDREVDLLEAVCKWISFNIKKRIVYLFEFFQKLHWSDIKSSQFLDILKKNPWIKKQNELNAIVMTILEMTIYNSNEKAATHNLRIEPRFETFSGPKICLLATMGESELITYDIFYEKEKLSSKLRLSTPLMHDDCQTNAYILSGGRVIKIDWTRKTYYLMENPDSIFSLLFGRVFQFKNKRGG